MIAAGTRELWQRKRRAIDVEDTVFYKGEWMDTGQAPLLSPTVFLAEQPPNYRLLPHFHRENQFQLFVDGQGSIGKQTLRAVTVHYAGAYTGYGPLDSGAAGLKYFTIRAAYDTGYIAVARAREEMPRGPKKSATSPPIALATAEALAALRVCSEEALIPATPEGLGAYFARLPAGAAHRVRHQPGSVGHFIFVLNGTLDYAGTSLGNWESLFLTSGELPDLRAGAGGAELVILSMPPKDTAYLDARSPAGAGV